MTPAEFSARHADDWARFEQLLAGERQAAEMAEFPARYRHICQQLALAQERRYPQEIIERLNALALAGQQFLYRPRRRLLPGIGAFLAGGFAIHVRRHHRLLWLSALIFYAPLMLGMAASWLSPELIYSVMPPEAVAGVESMYNSNQRVIGYARADDDNLAMFGFYISNNIGIGFTTFAAGIFAGIGSLFLLLYNGIYIGMIAGYLTARGHGENFWQFVCGHSSFELNAIVLCGMTGLLLGRALIAPGRQLRRDALVSAAHDAIPILYGAAAMLFVAAIVEAFWSSRTQIAPWIKYMMAASWWLMVVVYFWRAGRPAVLPDDVRGPQQKPEQTHAP